MRASMGMIYKTYPNPFSDFIQINYGVFQDAKVSLQVFDIQGRLVANLQEINLKPEKYTAEWRPGFQYSSWPLFYSPKNK